MIDYTKINSVSNSYIFYNNDTREKITSDKIDEIIDNVRFMVQATNYAYEESRRLCDGKREAIDKKHCPSEEEIRKMNFGDSISASIQREYYIREANEISGANSITSHFMNKYFHYERLLRQLKGVQNYLAHTKCT